MRAAWWRPALLTLALAAAAGCVADPTPSPTTVASPTLAPTATAEPTPTASAGATPSGEPTPSPEPTLGLPLPDETDERIVAVEVTPDVGADGGQVVVSVTSQADVRIDELVLRWPRELNRTLFLRPFVPSDDRLAPGAPLVQDWTKWVLGPGEDGEPAGTVSVGWGPLLAGATLTIPLDAVRRTDGPIEFDLQVLAGNGLLALPDGAPAELRIEIP